jgi:hypothetical protein
MKEKRKKKGKTYNAFNLSSIVPLLFDVRLGFEEVEDILSLLLLIESLLDFKGTELFNLILLFRMLSYIIIIIYYHYYFLLNHCSISKVQNYLI